MNYRSRPLRRGASVSGSRSAATLAGLFAVRIEKMRRADLLERVYRVASLRSKTEFRSANVIGFVK